MCHLVMSTHAFTEQLRSWSAASFGTGSAFAAATSAADGLSPPGIVQNGITGDPTAILWM